MPEGVYDVVANPHNSHSGAQPYGDHTSGTGLMLAVNGSAQLESIVWRQSVDVLPAHTYTFSGWLSNWSSAPQFNSDFQPTINGSTVGNFSSLTVAKIWSPFTFQWPSGASSLADIQILSLSTAGFGNDFALDDLAMNEVPEPGAALVCGCVALTQLRRRRR